ncbi:FUSC family protein [Leucobacter sp. GX24907]
MKQFLHRVGTAAVAMVRPARLLVALKMTVAATTAWVVGNLIPGELDDYAYYAPFGALIAMTPTIMSSLTSSIKALIGVLLGLLAAWALIFMGVNGVLAVALAVGISTMLAGIPGLGTGRDYIPLAAVFAFVVGGPDVKDFSFGFAVQFALGAVLGIAVNIIIPPPLETATAKHSVQDLRSRVADVVERIVDELGDDTGIGSSWTDLITDLETAAGGAHDDLRLARLSRRGNLRARNSQARVGDTQSVLTSLQRIIRQLHEFAQAFIVDAREGEAPEQEAAPRIPERIRDSLAIAGMSAAALIRDPQNRADRGQRERALAKLHEVEKSFDGDQSTDVHLRQRVSVVAYTLRQIIAEACAQASDQQRDPGHPS